MKWDNVLPYKFVIDFILESLIANFQARMHLHLPVNRLRRNTLSER